MYLGAVTYNVIKDWDLETILTKLPPLGFEAVELRTSHKHGVEVTLTSEERTKVKARFAQAKLRLLSFGSTYEFHSPDPAVRRKHIDDCKKWVDLAHDTGAWGVKVRPNGIAKELGPEKTIARIGESLRECGEYGARMGVEIWMEVHGRDTQNTPVSAAIMRATKHDNVGLCWNSNPTDIVNGSIKDSFAASFYHSQQVLVFQAAQSKWLEKSCGKAIRLPASNGSVSAYAIKLFRAYLPGGPCMHRSSVAAGRSPVAGCPIF